MCLMAMAWGLNARWPLVLIANRDEFHRRASRPMRWWGEPSILGGQDLEAGGTWLGISPQGRLALLTNVREPGRHREGLPSRGHLVTRWLDPRCDVDGLHQELQATEHNGYNLLALDLPHAAARVWSNRHGHRTLDPGLYGLSNAALDTPWPKVERLKRGLQRTLQSWPQGWHAQHEDEAAMIADAPDHDAMLVQLMALLTDRHQPADAELPATGVGLDWERRLGRIFIHTDDRAYGTRCSTVVAVEAAPGGGWTLHALEQSWDADGRPTERQRHSLIGEQPLSLSRSTAA